MFKNYIIYFVLVLFSFNYAQYFEVDIGYNRSNGAFEKYTDDGLSLRATYSNNIKSSKFFRWQGSFQYISFYNDNFDRAKFAFYDEKTNRFASHCFC